MIDWTEVIVTTIVGLLGGGTLTTGIFYALVHSRKGDEKSKLAQEEVLTETTLPIVPIPPSHPRTDDALLKSLEAHMNRQDEQITSIKAELAGTKLELADTRRRLSEVEHAMSHLRRSYNRLHRRALHVVTNWPAVRQSEHPPKLLDDLEPPE